MAWFVCVQVPVPGAIASLQMSPQGVVRSFYPLKGNEIAMGHNLFKGRQPGILSTQTAGNGPAAGGVSSRCCGPLHKDSVLNAALEIEQHKA